MAPNVQDAKARAAWHERLTGPLTISNLELEHVHVFHFYLKPENLVLSRTPRERRTDTKLLGMMLNTVEN